MKTVKEVSRLTGVSVRTLHHYDAVGLLRPTAVTPAGYRLYDDSALERLRSILLFRELHFSLKEIKAIMDDPAFDPAEALTQQIRLLELQHQRLGELIALARDIKNKGVEHVSFQPFSTDTIQQYKDEVKAKWGGTQAYQDYQERERRGAVPGDAAAGMMALFADMGALRQYAPEDPAVQEKVGQLQRFITENYYTCTTDILRGLGEMYAADPRFCRNIDRAGGEGTAQFVSRAIAVFCASAER